MRSSPLSTASAVASRPISAGAAAIADAPSRSTARADCTRRPDVLVDFPSAIRCSRRTAATATRSSCRSPALYRGDLCHVSGRQQQRRGHRRAADSIGRVFVTGATMYPSPDRAGRVGRVRLRPVDRRRRRRHRPDGMPDDWETQFGAEDLQRRRRRSGRRRRDQLAGVREQHAPARLLHALSRGRRDRHVLRRRSRALQPVQLASRSCCCGFSGEAPARKSSSCSRCRRTRASR